MTGLASVSNALPSGPTLQKSPPAELHLTSVDEATATPLDRNAYLSPILERSLHDASKAGQAWPPEEPTTDGPIEADIDFILIGTITAEPEFYSSALIRADDKGAAARAYAIGDVIAPGVVLEGVQERSITVLLEDGQIATMALISPAEQRELRRSQSAGGKKVVRRVRPNHYEVSDAALAPVYSDPEKVVSKVRVRRKGRGVRLTRLRRRTPLRKIGIHNGDVIKSFNGEPIRSEEDLVEALASVKYASSFTVEVRRRRRDQTLHYKVL